MTDDPFDSWFSVRFSSQMSWRTTERARLALELTQEACFGPLSRFHLNEGRMRPMKHFDIEKLIPRIVAGSLRFFEAEGEAPVPTEVGLDIDDAEWDEWAGHLVGGNLFAVSHALGTLCVRHPIHDLSPWLALLERVAGPLELRYGSIRDIRFTERKRDEYNERWISPQYCPYAERVMLFGAPEIARFGADYLRAAPAHEVRELECGAIVLLTSPRALDAFAPEDEAALDRVYHYLMAHPEAGKLR